MRILVLGLGNDLYGDDGVGLRVVRLLRDAWASESGVAGGPAEVEFAECAMSGAALLDVLHGFDALVVIDTVVKSPAVAGRVRVIDGRSVRLLASPSPHYISLPQTLALGRACGLAMPRTMRVVCVETAGPFVLGEGLSPEMTARIPRILSAAAAAVRAVAASPPRAAPRFRVRDTSP